MARTKPRQRLKYDTFRFTSGNFEIKELYSIDEIIDWCTLAYPRIIGVFRHATEQRSRRASHAEYESDKSVGLNRPRYAVVSTDNYIIGLDGKRSDLTHFIQRSIRHHFFRPRDLPGQLRTREKLAIRMAAQIEYKLLRFEIDRLCDEGDIWYDECLGIWNIKQSLIDEHTKTRHARKTQLKDDNRPYHGRPRKQTKRRGVPEGTSTGKSITS